MTENREQEKETEKKRRPARSKKRAPDLNTVYSINADGSRNFLHVADVKGRWHRLRTTIHSLLLLLFLALPWIHIDGKPIVLVDIPGRSAYLFGGTYTNQDFHLVFFLLIGVGLSIFVTTSLFGRIWCGFLCPQTLFMEGVFRPIERMVEGSRSTRIRRNKKGGADMVVRKIIKHTLFIVFCWFFTVAFMAYFIPVRELWQLVPLFPGHTTALIWSLFWTGMLYFDYSWFREQTCLIICPYGRLQSTLVDYDTIIIGYDEKRGEPREKGVNKGGDCIDCRRCVDVCPTGIDIRNGLQLECIGCTNCIDACNDIMKKIGKPTGLVRFDSSRLWGPCSSSAPPRGRTSTSPSCAARACPTPLTGGRSATSTPCTCKTRRTKRRSTSSPPRTTLWPATTVWTTSSRSRASSCRPWATSS